MKHLMKKIFLNIIAFLLIPVLVSGITLTADTLKVDDTIRFEGSTYDLFDTTLTVVDPTANNTITLPDASGTISLSGGVWTGLSDTPSSISPGLVLQGSVGGTALEFGQALNTTDNPTFNNLTTTNITAEQITSDIVTVNDTYLFSDGSTQRQGATQSGFDWHGDTALFKQNKDISTQTTTVTNIFFKPDGLKMYISSSSNTDVVFEFDLSTAWDLSTATLLQQTANIGQANGLFFRSDGLKMYSSNDFTIKEINLTAAWDISAFLSAQTILVSSENTNVGGIYFKPNGLSLYLVGRGGAEEVNEYTLTIAWDISTASFKQVFTLPSSTPNDIFFKPDGTIMYILGEVGDNLREYILSVPWDISTAVFDQSVNLVAGLTQGVYIKSDATKLYIVDSITERVDEYDLGLSVDGNADIGGDLSVTGNLGVGTSPNASIHAKNSTGLFSEIRNEAGAFNHRVIYSYFNFSGVRMYTHGVREDSNDLMFSIENDPTSDETPTLVLTMEETVGIGTRFPLALLNPLGITEQLRLSFDNTNFASFTVDSTGDLTIAPAGGNVDIAGDLSTTGNVTTGGSFVVQRTGTAVSTNTVSEVIIGVTDTTAARIITIQTSDIVEGRLFIIKDESGAAGTNNITVATQGSETIDGASTVVITTNYGVVRLYAASTTTLFIW